MCSSDLADAGLYGTENLSYIPGEVGASAVQNIGAYGVEVGDLIERVETRNIESGEPRTFVRDECRYGYRDSVFKNRLQGQYVVTAVTLRVSRRSRLHLDYGQLRSLFDTSAIPTPLQIREAVIAIRRSKLPEVSELGSAGSFFKNPVVSSALFEHIRSQWPDVPHYALDNGMVKIPAAWLIEQCGWKGVRRGDAGVYERHPLILVNYGKASGADIARLAHDVSDSVRAKFNVNILPEVNVI